MRRQELNSRFLMSYKPVQGFPESAFLLAENCCKAASIVSKEYICIPGNDMNRPDSKILSHGPAHPVI